MVVLSSQARVKERLTQFVNQTLDCGTQAIDSVLEVDVLSRNFSVITGASIHCPHMYCLLPYLTVITGKVAQTFKNDGTLKPEYPQIPTVTAMLKTC